MFERGSRDHPGEGSYTIDYYFSEEYLIRCSYEILSIHLLPNYCRRISASIHVLYNIFPGIIFFFSLYSGILGELHDRVDCIGGDIPRRSRNIVLGEAGISPVMQSTRGSLSTFFLRILKYAR